MPLWPIFRRKSLPCRWLETEVQRRPLHCDKHPPQEKGAARRVTNASRATALPEMNPSSVLFCSRHRVQRATISEVAYRGRSVVPSALTTGAETSGRGRQRDAGGWRVLDFRLFFQYEKCSADRPQRIILRTCSNQTET